MTLYTFTAIATVLSQLLFAGLCLAQHLTFAMHFNLQGARPQILKANHTHSTNIYWKNRGVTEAAWSVCLGQNSSQWTFSSIHSTKNFFLLTLNPSAITKHGYIMSAQGDGELCVCPLRGTWQWDQWLPQAQGVFPLPLAPWTLFYGLLGPSKLPLIAYVQSWLPHWAPQDKQLASWYSHPFVIQHRAWAPQILSKWLLINNFIQ